jgi:hypothetical protein
MVVVSVDAVGDQPGLGLVVEVVGAGDAESGEDLLGAVVLLTCRTR